MLTMPRQLGPIRRIPAVRQIVRSSRSASLPALLGETGRQDHQAAHSVAAQSRATSRTALAGTATTTTSTSSGSRASEG